MSSPAVPPNEAARLVALGDYDVLDTPGEPVFDDLVQLAAHVAETPIAFVSLVDGHRQWFKARVGLERAEVPRAVSFCAHVVATGASLFVPDARADARFADNPLVTDAPHVRCYGGKPLRTGEGYVLGTLGVVDTRARELSAAQREMLARLAAQVVSQLEARRVRLQLVRQREAARAAAERLTAVFEGMAEGVIVQVPGGAITMANPAAAQILGLSPDELHGRTSRDPRWRAVREDGTPQPGDAGPAMRCLSTGAPQRGVIVGVERPDGARAWLQVSAVPRVVGGRVVEAVTTFTDITAQRATDRQLTVGSLAAGIAHELGSPLAALSSHLDLARERLDALGGDVAELRACLDDARAGAERIARVVRAIRPLAHDAAPRFALDLDGAVAAVAIDAPPPRAAARAPRGRVVVVDDDPMMASTLQRVLARDHDVTAFSDPREALTALLAGPAPDVVVSDLMMPYLDGEELHARVRAHDPALADRFVFVSGGTTQPAIARFLATIPNPRLDKPFAIPALLEHVRALVARRR